MTTTLIAVPAANPVADRLVMAAWLLHLHGWHQGDYCTGNPATVPGCLCVRGAMHVAAGRRADDCELDKPLSLAVCPCEDPSHQLAVFLFLPLSVDGDGNEIEGSEPDAVSRWNDDPDTEFDDVIKALRKVAEQVRSREEVAS